MKTSFLQAVSAVILTLLFHALSVLTLSAQGTFDPVITGYEIRESVKILASDELGGRYPGTEGSTRAAEYVREKFSEAGLELLYNNGFQYFDAVVDVSAGKNNRLAVNGIDALASVDFVPFPFSKTAVSEANVVFAGYGFEIDQDSLKWFDYQDVDVTGKWVLILRGDPEMDKQESPFSRFGEDRDKVILARDKGAAGVLLVSGRSFDEKDELVTMYFDKTQSNAGLPVMQVKRTLADEILAPSGLTVDSLEAITIREMMPRSFELDTKVSGSADIVQKTVRARNVVGIIRGNDPVWREHCIVIGAHYDHLGMGGQGSGSRLLDSMAVHNGADDNASGTAGIIELAEYFSPRKEELRFSLVFVAFDGEEQGLLGSKYFVKDPPCETDKMKIMVNFDMIGRLNEEKRSVMVGGTGTAAEMEALLTEHAPAGLQLSFSPDGYGPSDHAAFYGESIPVVFISSGAHEDYHTPEDDWQLLNYEGEKEILDFASRFIEDLAATPEMLTFQEAGPRKESGRSGYRFKVTLGIMPDFTSSESGGLGVGGVKKDGPAFKGGMLKGDIITAIDGKAVTDIYDYMNRLQALKAGQVISVDVLRDGKKEVLIIQL